MFSYGNIDKTETFGDDKYRNPVTFDEPAVDMHKGGHHGNECHLGCQPTMGMVCPPIIECPQIRIVNRHIVHQVPHIIPVETKVINHHVYKHHYQPQFTTSEENVCSEVHEPHCGF